MKDLLAFVTARLREPSTFGAISVALLYLHVNVDPGVVKIALSYALVASVAAGVILSEKGKPLAQVASDVLAAVAEAGKAAPPVVQALLMTAMLAGAALALSACSQQSLDKFTASPIGRVACSAQLSAGGVAAQAVPAAAVAFDPGAAPTAPLLAAVAKGVQAELDADCAPPPPAAAAPVPTAPAPSVTVVAPAK